MQKIDFYKEYIEYTALYLDLDSGVDDWVFMFCAKQVFQIVFSNMVTHSNNLWILRMLGQFV